uniref:Uncharacterized protein n=1 Tax=Brassica oleracea TaxID=3712 RepID=A0A3P6CB42_BRAOL|nr:unnamed protein product [Brassica oleracea]
MKSPYIKTGASQSSGIFNRHRHGVSSSNNDTTSQIKPKLSIVHFRPLCNFIMVPLLLVLFKSATNFVIFKTWQIRYRARFMLDFI